MIWDIGSDCFKFVYKNNENAQKDGTRRNILLVYSSIFDPLGLIQPFILKPKLLIQDPSCLKCGCDDKIPDKVNNE